jgi:outer membrane receptor for ferrienterochelin and colicins
MALGTMRGCSFEYRGALTSSESDRMGSRIQRCVAITVASLGVPAWLCAQTPGMNASVRVRHDTVAVGRALVRSGVTRATTDSAGIARLRLRAGSDTVVVTKIGFRPESVVVAIRASGDTTIDVALVEQAAQVAPIIVISTRTERRLEQEPLRVEVLGGDDVGEKSEMRPAEATSLLSEMSGVREESRTPLGATNIRLQGLPGRYTAVLQDGLPLYGAQASSFTLVDVVPLDLRQAEVIKGASSALYGPQALGGVVNLISRRPPDTSEALVNQSAPSSTDLMAFDARALASSLSATLLAGAHQQQARDRDGDGWMEVPGFRRVEARPRLFWNDSAGHSAMMTVGGYTERRSAGGIVRPTAASPSLTIPDSMATTHVDAGLTGAWRLSGASSLASRISFSDESRRRHASAGIEHESHRSEFGEVSATHSTSRNVLVAGAAASNDPYDFAETVRLDATYTTMGVFVQETYTPVSAISGTLNGRCDRSNVYGTICSPRLSVLATTGGTWSARLSGGSGWFAPTPLTDETETFDLSRVFVPRPLIAERGSSVSLDVTGTRGPLQVNGTLFQNRVRNPLGVQRIAGDTAGAVNLVNTPGALTTHGGELFAVYNAEPIVATAYYAATRSREPSAETGLPRELPLTPRQAAGIDFALEDDESGAYGALEVFYTGRQALDDDPSATISRPYTTVGLLFAKSSGRATLFLNGENLTSVRLTNYEPLVRPSSGAGGRWTVDAWAPLEGRRVNLGLEWRL